MTNGRGDPSSVRTRSTTADVVAISRGIGSGRPEPFSLYKKLNRTTPIPRDRRVLAAASTERSDMFPPAPCAKTYTALSDPDDAASYTALVSSLPTATRHSVSLMRSTPPSVASVPTPSRRETGDRASACPHVTPHE